MANAFFNLPAPAADGAGAAVDVSTLGREKTFAIEGAFTGTVIVEFSNEGAAGPWAQLTTFTAGSKRTIAVAAQFMRARRTGASLIIPGLPNVDVGANDNGALFLDLPATAGDGTGASVDVSTLGTFNTVCVLGTFSGTVVVEISQDGVDFAECMVFNNPGFQSKVFTAQFMRVRRKNVLGGGLAGLPNVDVGAINDAGGGSAGATGPIRFWAGGRETYDTNTPDLVIGQFAMAAADYTFTTAQFKAVGARGDTVDAEVELFNLTDAVTVATLTFSSTATAEEVSADIAGSLPAASKIYEVRARLASAPAGGSDAVIIGSAYLELQP